MKELLHDLNIENLEKIVGKRFYRFEELAEEIDNLVGSEGLVLFESFKNEERDDCDFELIGAILNEEKDENDNFLGSVEQYDITIYYTKSKNHFYITETDYENL